MIGEDAAISTRARMLRENFDSGFAHPPAAERDAFDGVLTIRVCGEPYAVALDEVHGLFVDRRVVPLPARCPESMGITCLRTGIVAVYGLCAFLGYPLTETPMRWLISVGERQQFALAFERFEAYARVPRSQLLPAPATGGDGHIQGTATIAGERRPVISLRSIMHSVSTRS